MIARWVAQIKAQIKTSTEEYERKQLAERAAKLSGGVAVIRVGAPTEAAMQERKARVDDALHATRAAIAEGIVPGGGVAYLNLIPALECVTADAEEERMAQQREHHALQAPASQIAENAGVNGAVVLAEIRRRKTNSANHNLGYDALRDDYGDLVEWGIIDREGHAPGARKRVQRCRHAPEHRRSDCWNAGRCGREQRGAEWRRISAVVSRARFRNPGWQAQACHGPVQYGGPSWPCSGCRPPLSRLLRCTGGVRNDWLSRAAKVVAVAVVCPTLE